MALLPNVGDVPAVTGFATNVANPLERRDGIAAGDARVGILRRERQRPVAHRQGVAHLSLARAARLLLTAVEVERLGRVVQVIEVRPGLAGENRAQLAIGVTHAGRVRGVAAAADRVVVVHGAAVEVHLDEGLQLTPIGRRARLDVEARLAGAEVEIAALVLLRRMAPGDAGIRERVAQVLVEVVNEVGLHITVDRHRGVGARQLEGAGEVAADHRVGGGGGLRGRDRRLLLLELVEPRLKRVDLRLQVVRLTRERRTRHHREGSAGTQQGRSQRLIEHGTSSRFFRLGCLGMARRMASRDMMFLTAQAFPVNAIQPQSGHKPPTRDFFATVPILRPAQAVNAIAEGGPRCRRTAEVEARRPPRGP